MSGGGIQGNSLSNPQFRPEQNSLTPMMLFDAFQQQYGNPWQQRSQQPSPMPSAYGAPQPAQPPAPPQPNQAFSSMTEIATNSPGIGTKPAAGGK